MICKRSELECIRSAMKDLASSEPLIDLMVYEDALKTTTRLEILGTARPNSLETARTFRESQGANRHVLPERERGVQAVMGVNIRAHIYLRVF